MDVVAPNEVATFESYIDTKTKKWAMNIWKCRFWQMHNQVLTVYYEKADVKKNKYTKKYTILQGEKWEEKPWGIKLETKEEGWLYGSIHSKAEWAGWLHAFVVLEHNLNPPVRKNSTSRPPRRLSLDTTDVRSSVSSIEDVDSSEESSPTRRVSFNGGVRVRTIPAVDDDDKGDLFYTEKELDRMQKATPEGALLLNKRRMPVLA
ncbi:hypothetical protein LEN26_004274 [Aphanomyces euteiches]|nr:hypothetical protein LEN26_018233 [Aphanomyces euteiches]KAH9128682.1 hypothetical protein AeMF1_001179 [Aphanomyces euteiches]KAH9149358.1 hypothetical protein LEN26_004274 [Aphanomyces euteiches]KAH9183486.1 hypothetical protein AeNC1_014536 [Aphanomyces euteiches]